LLSLGVDLVAQANFIASSAAGESQDIAPRDSMMGSLSLPTLDQSSPMRTSAWQSEGEMTGNLAANDSLSLFVSLEQKNALPRRHADDWQSEDWLFTDDPNEVLKIPFLESESWLSDPDQMRPEPLNASQLDTSAIPDRLSEGHAAQVPIDDLSKDMPDEQANCQFASNCFMRSAFQILPEGSSTTCTKALSLIFHLNRQGWSIANLQERLKAGIVQASADGEQCHIRDDILFEVLTKISVSKVT
jgi:hypothetical protein